MPFAKDNTISFIAKATKRWGLKYDYNKVEYINCRTPVTIVCRKHQHAFRQTPKAHFTAKRHCCPLCYKEVEGIYKNQWRNSPPVRTALLTSMPSLINHVFR